MIAGVCTIVIGFLVIWLIVGYIFIPVRLLLGALLVWMLGFPLGYLMLFVKERIWVVLSSLLFLFMQACLLAVPLSNVPQDEWPLVVVGNIAFYTCWMAVILFSPVKQLTRKLSFVVLGVLTLVVLSEISKLNLHQYLKPAKVSEISLPAHNLSSHADA